MLSDDIDVINIANNWKKNGPHYYEKANEDDIIRYYRWKNTGNPLLEGENLKREWGENKVRSMKQVDGIWTTGLSPYRGCRKEPSTRYR